MDECESDQASEASRLSLDAAERNDGTSQPRFRELCARSKSPTPTRFLSSNTTGTSTLLPTQTRAVSVERRRPTPGVSTSVHGTSVDIELAAGKASGSKFTDSLWPSRMRTQSAPFQSDTSSLPVTKSENLSQEAVSDHTLKPSSNVAYKQAAIFPASSKVAPEKMRAILKGENVQSENLKPLDGSHVRIVDQHRWPSTTGSNVLSKNVNLTDESTESGATLNTHVGASASRTRTQSAPFEFDTSSLPVTKSENLSPEAVSDHALKPSSNVAYKQTAIFPVSSKAAPEKMRAILKGKNINDELENLKPPDGSHVRLVDQHRWPRTTGSNVLSKNINLLDESTEIGITPDTSAMVPAPRRMSLPSYSSKPLQESSSDAVWLSSDCLEGPTLALFRGADSSLSTTRVITVPSKGVNPSPAPTGVGLLPSRGDNPTSIATRVDSASSRGVNPTSTATGVDPAPSRGVSPTPTSTGVDPALAKGVNPPLFATQHLAPFRRVNPTPTATRVNPSLAARGVISSVTTREIDPTSVGGVNTPAVRGVNPSIAAKRVGPSLATTEIDHTLAIRKIDPTPVREVSSTRAGEVSATPIVRGLSPMPTARGVSSTPAARKVSPMPVVRGVSPTSAVQGASPMPVVGGADFMPVVQGADSTPADSNPGPTASGANPTTNARAVSSTRDARTVNPTQMRPSSSRQPSNSNTVSGFKDVGPCPVRDVAPYARGDDLAPVRGVSPSPTTRGTNLAPLRGVGHFLSSMGVSLTSVVKGVKPTPSAREVNPPRVVRGVSPTPSTRAVSPPRATRGVSPTPASIGVSPMPADGQVNLVPIARGARPTSVARGASPTSAAKGAAPATDARTVSPNRDAKAICPTRDAIEVSPTRDARAISPTCNAKAVNPTYIRPSSPMQSCKTNTVSVFKEIGHSPVRDDVGPSARVDGLAPVRGFSPSPPTKGTSLAPLRVIGHFLSSMGGSLTSVVKVVKPTPFKKEVSPSHAVRGVSPTPSTRAVSPPHATRGVTPTPIRPSSPRQSCNLNTASTSAEIGPLAKGVSTRATGAGLAPIWPSMPKHSSNLNMASIFTKIADSKKGKVAYDIEEAQYWVLLYNRQMQWQFLNASTEAALDLQKATAEESFFNMSRTISELRDSIAAKKIDINLLIMQLKLYAVLNRQMLYIDEWASIQKEHESALSGATIDLQACTRRLPMTEGAKADIKSLKMVVYTTLQVMMTMVSSIRSMLSKLERTHCLASELANLASQERALLDECEIILASTDPLQVEECSLRAFLIQSKQACNSE